MGLFTLLNQLINLLAPALVVGPLLALAAPLVQKKVALRHSWLWHSVLNVIAAALALLEATSFEALIQAITTDLAVLLGVEHHRVEAERPGRRGVSSDLDVEVAE